MDVQQSRGAPRSCGNTAHRTGIGSFRRGSMEEKVAQHLHRGATSSRTSATKSYVYPPTDWHSNYPALSGDPKLRRAGFLRTLCNRDSARSDPPSHASLSMLRRSILGVRAIGAAHLRRSFHATRAVKVWRPLFPPCAKNSWRCYLQGLDPRMREFALRRTNRCLHTVG